MKYSPAEDWKDGKKIFDILILVKNKQKRKNFAHLFAYVRKKLYFCVAKRKNNTTMAQETLNSLIQVMFTLSLPEQKRVIAEMQANVRKLSSRGVDESVRQQLIASAEEGIAEIERGEYFTNDEVLDRMNERLERSYAVAVWLSKSTDPKEQKGITARLLTILLMSLAGNAQNNMFVLYIPRSSN